MSRDVIDQWSRSLRVSGRRRRAISMELRSHLQAAQEDLERAGWRPDDAARESLVRLGDPSEIVDGFEQVYRPSRRKQLGLAFALATGMLLGVYGIGGSLASAKPTITHPALKHVRVPASELRQPTTHTRSAGNAYILGLTMIQPPPMGQTAAPTNHQR